MIKKHNKAFSLVELSIVILIIGVLIAAVGQGVELLYDARISAARILTQGSRVNSLKGLSLWLETSMENSFSTSEANDGSTITAWNDINPQARDKNNFAASGAARPTYKTSIINNLPAVKFDGANTYMDSALTFAMNTGLTVFAVIRPNTIPSSGIANIIASAASTHNGHFGVKISAPAYLNAYLSCGYCPLTKATLPISANQNFLIEAINISESTKSFYLNKTAPVTSSPIMTEDNMGYPALLEIGACYNGSYACPAARDAYFDGYIGELILFDRPLSTKDRLAVESYLAKKWNL